MMSQVTNKVRVHTHIASGRIRTVAPLRAPKSLHTYRQLLLKVPLQPRGSNIVACIVRTKTTVIRESVRFPTATRPLILYTFSPQRPQMCNGRVNKKKIYSTNLGARPRRAPCCGARSQVRHVHNVATVSPTHNACRPYAGSCVLCEGHRCRGNHIRNSSGAAVACPFWCTTLNCQLPTHNIVVYAQSRLHARVRVPSACDQCRHDHLCRITQPSVTTLYVPAVTTARQCHRIWA